MTTPSIPPSRTGSLPLPQDWQGRTPERWTVRTPGGLILADWREPHGWRVAVEDAVCRVAVPDYAPIEKGYRLRLADGAGAALDLTFDVTAS